MAEIKKPSEENEPVSVETAKVIQGISLVFCGALTMLEALHPHVSLAPSAILDLVTGNVESLKGVAAEKRAAAVQREDEPYESQTTGDRTVDSVPVSSDASAHVDGGHAGNASEEMPTTTLTVDDITKIIVRKIKQNRANNEKIGQILKNYGIAKVSELPVSKYESFVTDLSAI